MLYDNFDDYNFSIVIFHFQNDPSAVAKESMSLSYSAMHGLAKTIKILLIDKRWTLVNHCQRGIADRS